MAPLEREFAEAWGRMKYMSKKKNLFSKDVKETPLETTIPIYRGKESSDTLNAPLERVT